MKTKLNFLILLFSFLLCLALSSCQEDPVVITPTNTIPDTTNTNTTTTTTNTNNNDKSCFEEENFPVNLDQLPTCKEGRFIDSLDFKSKMIGQWNLRLRQCFYTQADADHPTCYEPGYYSLEFKADGTMTAIAESDTTSGLVWKIVGEETGADYLFLELDQELEHLNGPIRFCDELLVFGEWHQQLCDKYYVRE